MNALKEIAVLVKHLAAVRKHIVVFLRRLTEVHNYGWRAARDLGIKPNELTTFDQGVTESFLAMYGRKPRYALDAFRLVFALYGKIATSELFSVRHSGESIGSDATWMMLERRFGSFVAAYDMPAKLFYVDAFGMGV
jgi:hypothetical protein